MSTARLEEMIIHALEELKGEDILRLDVRELSDVMDTLIIVSGNSNRHVKSLVENAVDEARQVGFRPQGIEGKEAGDWVLVDFGDVVVHAMLPATRQFYDLERLWQLEPAGRAGD